MRRLVSALAGLTGLVGLIVVAATCRRVVRVEVHGHSMAPGLHPGDRVVAVRGLRARSGDVVAAADPRHPRRLLVKRAVAVGGDGSVELAGDNIDASTDSRTFGTVGAPLVVGRVVWRYWPRHRRGTLGGSSRPVVR
ncbi:MAG: nickel-type superoxide dismutase maturation protease [Actinomycetota bacterium]|nr:nickel-type superoxide dismutase maturation protease [Actinomycetota bacterium]